jgi:hypothetical protein
MGRFLHPCTTTCTNSGAPRPGPDTCACSRRGPTTRTSPAPQHPKLAPSLPPVRPRTKLHQHATPASHPTSPAPLPSWHASLIKSFSWLPTCPNLLPSPSRWSGTSVAASADPCTVPTVPQWHVVPQWHAHAVSHPVLTPPPPGVASCTPNVPWVCTRARITCSLQH